MSDKTGIEWTDATWNPVTGCSKVSAGCKHCYAEREWPRMTKLVPAYAGREFTDVRTHADRLDQPLRWKRPRKVFVNSMSDLFHPDVPFEFIDKVFGVMSMAPQHTFQILTKRAERMAEVVPELAKRHACKDGTLWPLPNVWLGVSVEDQAAADERIPLLLDTPAAVRWISAEPLLGPVNLRHLNDEKEDNEIDCLEPWTWEQEVDAWRGSSDTWEDDFSDWYNGKEINASGPMHNKIDWVVVGGESGPKARPMYPDWARSLRDQCAEAGVPFLFKQWGEWWPNCYLKEDGSRDETTMWMDRVGKKRAGRLLDGVQHDGYPKGGAA